MRKHHKLPRTRRTLEESDNADRWLVSYADFITLLFAFFVVMYAISSINEGKYRVLSDTLIAAFKTPPKATEPVQIGEPQTDKISDAQTAIGVPKPIRVEPPKADSKNSRMALIAKTVEKSLRPLINQDLIKVSHNQFWVEVEMNTNILFSSGSAELEEEGIGPLRQLARVLQRLPNPIEVEGHTDNLPIKTPVFPSNWELSAARAASVVHLFAKQGVSPQQLSATGYGEFRPKASNNTIAGRRENRRVSVIILADNNARRMQKSGPAATSATSENP